jgi:pectate lyase
MSKVSVLLVILCVCVFGCKDDGTILVSSVSLGENLWLTVGEEVSLTPVIRPSNATWKTSEYIGWYSSDVYVVEVDRNGNIIASSIGEAVITAKMSDGSEKSGSITVTVTEPELIPVPLESITINDEDFSLIAGNDITLNVTLIPAANISNVTWSSSNIGVAAVSRNGQVTTFSPGTAIITAASKTNPAVKDSVTVTVNSASGIAMTPQEIFNSLKGKKVSTYGWADRANDDTGLSYANPANLTLIDDATYPNPVAKRTAFTGAIDTDDVKFIIISGDIDLSDGRISDDDKSFFEQFGPSPNYRRVNGDIRFNLRSNTTLIGVNNARLMFGGININNRVNVIIRNVTFYDAHGSTEQDTRYFPNSKASVDALTVQGTSNGVWVDHCKFTDGTCTDMIRNFNHDGAFDIPRGKNITVSWCEFSNHDKVMLVAGGDSAANAVQTERQITLHHNYFHYATQRMPRSRGTQMHVYNNYYDDIGVEGNTGYAMGPGWGSHYIVENNFFGSIMSNKVVDWYDNAEYPAIVWSAGNNKTVARSANDKTNGSKPWEPVYVYSLDHHEGLPISIPAGAGPTLEFLK